MTTILESAERWLKFGIAPIPILARGKKPTRPWLEYRASLPSYTDLLNWFGGDSNLNLAIVCGWKNLVVLDFDSRPAWADWLDWLTVARPEMTAQVLTAWQVATSRGRHLYVRLSQPAQSRSLRSMDIDIQSQGRYALVPPSIHPSGVSYRILNPTSRILSCEMLSDLLPAEALVDAAVSNPDPDSPLRITLPDLATVASADPWEAAARAVEFDRARGLARIKSSFRIESWFPERTRSSSDGRWWLTRCPWHDDKNPSFWIDAQRQLCGCHAGCTPRPLDVIDVFARVCSLSNEEAIRQLSRAAGS